MSNPHKEGSAEWTAREREIARKVGSSGNYIGAQEVRRQQEARVQEQRARQTSSTGGCFPSTAMVSTPAGTRAIGELREGDAVWAYGEDGLMVSRRILRKQQYGRRELLALSLENGRVVRVTATHSFLTVQGWTPARALRPGDELLSVDGMRTVVRCINAAGSVEAVYNLVVEHDFSFVADGVVVHSFTRQRRACVVAWRLVMVMQRILSALQNAIERKVLCCPFPTP